MENITVPFSSLVLSDINVRKTNSDLALDALAASILEHGLIQPLVVTAIKARRSTTYAVHAGGRRCRAIAQLVETGKLPQDHGVDVRVFANRAAAAREISLAENLIRESMLGHIARAVLFVRVRGRPTAALTQKAGGGRPTPRIAQRCPIAM